MQKYSRVLRLHHQDVTTMGISDMNIPTVLSNDSGCNNHLFRQVLVGLRCSMFAVAE